MRRWSGIAGIVFVVLAFVSRLVPGNVPDPDKRDAIARFAKFYADKSHNDSAVIGFVLGVVGLFAFAWFLGGLWSMLRNAEGAATAPTIIVAVGGAAFVALGMAYHAFADVVGVTLHFSKGYTIVNGFDPATALLFSSVAQGIFLASMLAVGAATAAAAAVILRTRALPVWLAWVGLVIAALCLATIPPLTFVAGILLAVWVLVISALMIQADVRGTPAPA
jgi:hypothetical protein